MWKMSAGVEGASSLVIHEDEDQMVRIHRESQRDDEAAEQFALSGAGGPGDQSVGPVRHQIDCDGAMLGHSERGGGSRARCLPPPTGRR